ncbi:uncharacterized protein LOC121990390 [Zingiber officinale]|uniref:uncharacterized protein LOC121990390 n=1 Tax=Zingiber officinale TaxID=94328 RepID=UPI001C4BB2BF|nr:uncharacterized protein LOC121990390 [Zingiber officinale]
MKRSSECAVSPLLSKPSGKAPRRQRGSPAAAGRAKSAASKGNAGTKRGGIRISSKASEPEPQHSPSAPSFSVSEEMMAVAEWMDWQVELGDLWRSLYWVEEEKLSGWFPFVDEDFLCSDARGGEGSSGLFWEEADHDIWQLHHIHEIPQTASK